MEGGGLIDTDCSVLGLGRPRYFWGVPGQADLRSADREGRVWWHFNFFLYIKGVGGHSGHLVISSW